MPNLPTPCEEKLGLTKQTKIFSIGIPKENFSEETRIPITPQGVEIFVANGHKVYIERGSGNAAHFSDNAYSEAGAIIVKNHSQPFDCDIVLKMTPPSVDECAFLKQGSIVISFLQLHDEGIVLLKALINSKANAISISMLPEYNIGEIEGINTINIAAHLLDIEHEGKGINLGGITGNPPTEIVVIGACETTRTICNIAIAMGAIVKVFDNSLRNLRELTQQLPQHIFTSILHPQAISKALCSADVLIGTRTEPGQYHFMVTEDQIKLMKNHAVAIDLNICNGGSFESSHATSPGKPTYIYNNIIHHCLPDLSIATPHTASIGISNILTPLIQKLAETGGLETLAGIDKEFASAIYAYRGILTDENIGKCFGINSRDIGLILL